MSNSKYLLAASAAASILSAAGAAHAATVATLAVTASTASTTIGGSLSVSTNTGTGTGVLDDGGTFTMNLTEIGTIVFGTHQTLTITAADTLTGVYAAGTFTATGGSSDVLTCTGGTDCGPAIGSTTFTSATGVITLAAGGVVHAVAAPDGGAAAETLSYTVAPSVPLPPAAWLLGSGLLGLVATARRRVAGLKS